MQKKKKLIRRVLWVRQPLIGHFRLPEKLSPIFFLQTLRIVNFLWSLVFGWEKYYEIILTSFFLQEEFFIFPWQSKVLVSSKDCNWGSSKEKEKWVCSEISWKKIKQNFFKFFFCWFSHFFPFQNFSDFLKKIS